MDAHGTNQWSPSTSPYAPPTPQTPATPMAGAPVGAQVGVGVGDGVQGPNAYTDWGSRVVAFIIDLLVVVLGTLVCVGIAFGLGTAIGQSDGGITGIAVGVYGAYVIGFVYRIVGASASSGQSIGRKVARFRLSKQNGLGRVGIFRAMWRELARVFSALPLGLGYFAPLWSARRQTFHDSLSGTVARNVTVQGSAKASTVALLTTTMIVGLGAGVLGAQIAKSDVSSYDPYAEGWLDDGAEFESEVTTPIAEKDPCTLGGDGNFTVDEPSVISTGSGPVRIALRVNDTCGERREINHIEYAYSGSGCSFGGAFDLPTSLVLDPYGSGSVVLEFPAGACNPGSDPDTDTVRARFEPDPGSATADADATYTGPLPGYSLGSGGTTGGSGSTSSGGTTGGSATPTTTVDRPLPMGSWTVVIQSRIASESGARSDVESAASRARDAGYTVHVIDTEAYPSLRPGVVAALTGTYSTCVDAKSAAATIQSRLGTSGDSTYQRYLSEDTSYRDIGATKC